MYRATTGFQLLGRDVAKKKPASRPKRTREHVIASQSQNYVEKFFIDKGHTVDRPTDYGTDVLANTFDEHGYAENGDIRLQLKASDNLKLSTDKSYISFAIESKHYDLWLNEPYPVFLILYDATKAEAYYLYMQEYFTAGMSKKPRTNAETMTVRIPVKNRFTEHTVDYMRERKAAILQQIKGKIEHES